MQLDEGMRGLEAGLCSSCWVAVAFLGWGTSVLGVGLKRGITWPGCFSSSCAVLVGFKCSLTVMWSLIVLQVPAGGGLALCGFS
jgi:hypothetical protein